MQKSLRNSIKLTGFGYHIATELEIGAIISTSVFCVDKSCFTRLGHIRIYNMYVCIYICAHVYSM